ncbi:hypothetical protein IX84_22175 [Phaeodactylibacter xiamenensis]|uniref:CHAT domain-containing protein n=2 Tax=Phaeodactylibacter xiamenensis TaxID=1524460 RepID=A0A098S5I8_9BACT|nr:hypothetical protein IX84_22175 [Phaeodactylibacter xiamenensis]
MYFSLKPFISLLLLTCIATYSTGQSISYKIAQAYQQKADQFLEQEQFGLALRHYHKSIKLLQNERDSLSNLLLSESYQKAGEAHGKKMNYDSTEWYFSKCLSTLQSLYGSNSRQSVKFMNHYAGFYAGSGDWKASLQMRLNALEIAESTEGIQDLIVILCNNIAILYLGIKENTFARTYIEKGIASLQSCGLPPHKRAIFLANYSNILSNDGETELAFEVINKAEELTSNNTYAIVSLLQIKAEMFRRIGDHESSLRSEQKRLKHLLADPIGPNDLAIARLMLAKDLRTLGKADKALLQLDTIIDEFSGQQVEDILSDVYFEKGMCNLQISKPDKAIDFLQQSLILNSYQNNSVKTLNRYARGFNCFFYLAEAYRQKEAPLLAFDAYNKADSCLIEQRKQILVQSSKEKLGPDALALAERLLSLKGMPHTIEYTEACFRVIEHSKSLILYESFLSSKATQIAELPAELRNHEQEVLRAINSAQINLSNAVEKGVPRASAKYQRLRARLNDAYLDFRRLTAEYKRNHPNYFRLKYDFSPVSDSYVQKKLINDNQALLEYLVGDSSIFIFLIPKEGAPILKEVKKDFPLEDWVAKFREGVSNTNKVETYLKYAQLLYDNLIQPVAEQLPERVIIVPDGVLGYLPFSALLSGQPGSLGNLSTYPFLLKEHQFSYSYSATLLKEMQDKEHRHEAEGQLLAFAPFFEEETTTVNEQRSDVWKGLPASGPEVQQAASSFPDNHLIMLGKEATKAAFLKSAAKYRFLHIATHGQADGRVGDYSFLVFASPTDTSTAARLFVRELYNLELNADMVVLSACQVGAGQLQRGEGIISLARAFAYAGAKSLVFPIWSVNDGKTAELMGYFYKYLAEGAPKDEALRSAQLKYLDQQPSNFAKHPAFWAAFSAVGDMAPIK